MQYEPLNPTSEGRPCPFFRDACPGHHKGCAFWRKEIVEQHGKATPIENCIFILQYEVAFQQVVEEIRTQGSINTVNNQAHVDRELLSKVLFAMGYKGLSPDKSLDSGENEEPKSLQGGSQDGRIG